MRCECVYMLHGLCSHCLARMSPKDHMRDAMLAFVWVEMAMRGMQPHKSARKLHAAWRQWASDTWEPAIMGDK